MAGHFAFEEEKLPDKLNFSVWLKIGRYALKEWPLLLLCLLTTIFVTFYDSSFVPVMNAGAIAAADSFPIAVNSIWEVSLDVTFLFGIRVSLSYAGFLIAMGVMIIIRAFAIWAMFFYQNIISMHIMTRLRRDTFRKIQELSFSYFDKNSSGWLIARMQNDTASIGDVLSNTLNTISWSVFDLFFAIVTMFSVNWVYSLVLLASMPLVAIIVPFFEAAILKRHRTARNAYSHYVGWIAEAIDGAKTIKTLSIEQRIAQEAEDITEDIRRKRFRASRVNAFFNPLLEMISTLMIALVVFLSLDGSLPKEFSIDAATTILFIGFVGSIYSPLEGLAETFSEFMASQAGAEKVMQLLEAPVEIVDKKEVMQKYGDLFHPKKDSYEKLHGKIDFEDVTFDYGNGIEVIHPLTLHIKAGTSVAIVGETGSGKTTTVNLLCRFYEPSSGVIKVDDVDYLDRSLGWLRSNIGYVQQTPFVFTGTYRENIAYGKPDATMQEIRDAAKLVGIDEFIMSEPNGYDTYLRDGGGQLSQGQKQLISFARAILRDPAILILDEATSSIDTETEKEVQKAIAKLLKGRTSITIAHRLSTIVDCDRILLMDKGSIIEDGSHKELMEKKGAYYSLYMSQFKELSLGEQLDAYDSQIAGKEVKL